MLTINSPSKLFSFTSSLFTNIQRLDRCIKVGLFLQTKAWVRDHFYILDTDGKRKELSWEIGQPHKSKLRRPDTLENCWQLDEVLIRTNHWNISAVLNAYDTDQLNVRQTNRNIGKIIWPKTTYLQHITDVADKCSRYRRSWYPFPRHVSHLQQNYLIME